MPFLGPTSAKKNALRKIAAEQHGYFTANQAVKNGYCTAHHSYHIKRNNWLRVDTGLFRFPDQPDSLESDFTRWYLWSRNLDGQPQGVISHQSALKLRGLGDYDPDHVHLTVPTSFRKQDQPGVVVHKASLNLSAIESRPGFLVTRLPRTLEDLRTFLEEKGLWLETVERALAAGTLSREESFALGFSAPTFLGGQAASGPPPHNDKNANPAECGETGGRRETAPATADADPVLLASAGAPSIPPALAPTPESTVPQDSAHGREWIYKMIFLRTNPMNRNYRRRAQAGFTLVELMVVVTIISVLAALLLPVLDKATAAAKAAYCASNTRQIFLGVSEYAGDNGGYLVTAICPIGLVDASSARIFWQVSLSKYVTGVIYTDPNTYDLSKAFMAAHCRESSFQVYHCPADTKKWMFPIYSEGQSWSYGVPISLGSTLFPFRLLHNIRTPSQKLYLADAVGRDIYGSEYVDWTYPGAPGAPDLHRHQDAYANALMLDGHVELLHASDRNRSDLANYNK